MSELTGNDYRKDVIESLQFKKLPDDLKVSTMTIICKLNINFDLENISKYIDLSVNDVISVKWGSMSYTNRTLIAKKGKKKKKVKRSFYNQTTLIVKTKKTKPINIKLFQNGSLHATGCKDITELFDTIELLFNKLKVIKAIVNPLNINEIIEKAFVSDVSRLKLENLYDFQIVMINSNFNIGFKINREKLYELLINDGYTCTYDPLIHACVNCKFTYAQNQIISIFIFESGSIIITGANRSDQIIAAYNFINKFILTNYHYVANNSNFNRHKTIMKFIK